MGLTEKDISLLKKIFIANLNNGQSVKVYLFGSRANNEHQKYSDVDILIESEPKLSMLQISNIKEQVEDSNTPYIFDFVFKEDVYQHYEKEILKSLQLLFSM